MFNNFEHRLMDILKPLPLAGRDVYVGVSGGVDSMALLAAIVQLKRPLKLKKIHAVHVHHGKTPRASKQLDYRNRAWRFVRRYCESNGIDFVSNLTALSGKSYNFSCTPELLLKSEAQLREFRFNYFNQIVNEKDYLLLAQHQDDLFETRLINLIRGSGGLGLDSMSLLNKNVARPFLEFSKKELVKYTKLKKIKYIKDPSNTQVEPLRNWLRKSWLPMLEKKRTGALSTMARSLEVLAEETAPKKQASLYVNDCEIDMPQFLLLDESQKRQALAIYMNQLNLPNYGRSHIQEVLKRIDSPGIVHNFSLLKCAWTIDARCIKAIPDHGSKVRR